MLAKTAVNTVECAETYQSGARTEGTSIEDKTAAACGEKREKENSISSSPDPPPPPRISPSPLALLFLSPLSPLSMFVPGSSLSQETFSAVVCEKNVSPV